MKMRTAVILATAFLLLAVLVGVVYVVQQHRADRELDDRLIALFRASAGKPWQWKAKLVIADYLQVRRALLVRRDFMTTNREIRAELRKLDEEIAATMNWSEPVREYTLPCLRY